MTTQPAYQLLIRSAKQLVQVTSEKQLFLTSAQQNQVVVLEGGDDNGGYSLVVNKEGLIEKVGKDQDVMEWMGGKEAEVVINATGKVIMPGLVDGHTHAVWAGDRVHEFAMKLAGASYLDVHKAGGGIHFTVRHVRQASEEELFSNLKTYLGRMLQAGTTLVEVKTGYGLDLETEVKMLKVIQRVIKDPSVAIDISVTYCAAHAVPQGKTAEEATVDIVSKQLPEVQRLVGLGEVTVHNIDVFCEQGVFSVEQTRRILMAGVAMGLNVNFHAEELNRLHSAEMGAELNSTAMSHLEEVSDEGIQLMATHSTIATLLPTTAHLLRLTPPPARKMIDAGVPVALGSDFNPNAHCFAMPIVMHLACIQLRLSMPEALVAATINSAASLKRSHDAGSLEEGKLGDVIVLDAPRWEHLIYQLGSHQHTISKVIKRGRVVHSLNGGGQPS